MSALARKISDRRSTLGPSSLDVVELKVGPVVELKKRGYHFRSDHLRELKRLVLDLQLDDYDFSQAEVLRVALANFLSLSVGEQVQQLERYRNHESELGVGIGSVRP